MAMTSGFQATSMILASCQTDSVLLNGGVSWEAWGGSVQMQLSTPTASPSA